MGMMRWWLGREMWSSRYFEFPLTVCVGVSGEYAMRLIDSGVELWDFRQLMLQVRLMYERIQGRDRDTQGHGDRASEGWIKGRYMQEMRKCFMHGF